MIGPINLDALTAAVTEAEGVEASVEAFVQAQADATKKAVTDALTADNAADQGSVDAANTAIQAVADRIKTNSAKLSALITAPAPTA